MARKPTHKKSKKEPAVQIFTTPSNTQPVGSPEWLYDEIMRCIEPDLMLTSIPTLSKKYEGETEKENLYRMAAYEVAFQLFDEAYAYVSEQLLAGVHDLKGQARADVRQREQREHDQGIADIESRLSDSK